jgi:hypothetical protein
MDHFLHDSIKNDADAEASSWQDICESRDRRDFARAAIASKAGQLTSEDLWGLMSVRPCLAHDTVYTVAMQPSTDYYVTRVSVSKADKVIGRRIWDSLIKTRQEEKDARQVRGTSTARRR